MLNADNKGFLFKYFSCSSILLLLATVAKVLKVKASKNKIYNSIVDFISILPVSFTRAMSNSFLNFCVLDNNVGELVDIYSPSHTV